MLLLAKISSLNKKKQRPAYAGRCIPFCLWMACVGLAETRLLILAAASIAFSAIGDRDDTGGIRAFTRRIFRSCPD